LLLHKFHRYCM